VATEKFTLEKSFQPRMNAARWSRNQSSAAILSISIGQNRRRPCEFSRAAVAQISNLLYRRASSLRAAGRLSVSDRSCRLPIGNRRYSRLEICATRTQVGLRGLRQFCGIVMQRGGAATEAEGNAQLNGRDAKHAEVSRRSISALFASLRSNMAAEYLRRPRRFPRIVVRVDTNDTDWGFVNGSAYCLASPSPCEFASMRVHSRLAVRALLALCSRVDTLERCP